MEGTAVRRRESDERRTRTNSKIAFFFILLNMSRLIKPLVSGVRGRCNDRTSTCSSMSSIVSTRV